MKLRYGIIGTASIAPRFVQAVRAYGDEVCAIASRSFEKAETFAKTYMIEKAYGCYDEVYQDQAIDIVYIATPNATHKDEAMKALRVHKHVIIEKPFTLCFADALAIFQYAKEQGCFVMEAQKSVFLPATRKVKEVLETEALGTCKQISMMSCFPGLYPVDHWMYTAQGGVLHGSGTYTIEYLMYLFDNPDFEVQASTDECAQGAIIDASLNLVLNGHLLADSHITMKVQTDQAAVFYCEQGFIRVEHFWKAREVIVHPYEGEEEILSFPVEFEMMYEAAHIHDCIDQGLLTSPIMSAERTILCTQIIEGLIQEEQEA